MADPEALDNPDIAQKAFAQYSSDNGRTWSEPALLFEFPREKGAFGGSGILCDRDGVIHLFGLHFFANDVHDYDNWDAFKCPLWHTMSADGANTWTPIQYCDFGAQYTGSVNSVLQLNSGRILVPIAYYSRRKTGRFVSRTTFSDDGGRSWRPSKGECVVDTGGSECESGACEPVAIQLQDDQVLMLIRTQAGYLYQSLSSDGGDTWTTPVPSQFVSSNSPGSLLRLRDGRIILVWNNCSFGNVEGFRDDRAVLNAAISADDARTWTGYREIARIGEPMGNGKVSGQVTYPYLAESADGAVIVAHVRAEMDWESWEMAILRLRPDWLTEASFQDNFADGLANWMTSGTEGASIITHPDRPDAQVLALRKPKADVPAGASLNFPFGVKGDLTLRLRLEPGFQGARLCLTDFFSLPGYPEDGRFGISLSPTGQLSVATRAGEYRLTKPLLQPGFPKLSVQTRRPEFTPTDVTLEPGTWHTVGFAWDCARGICLLTLDGAHVADPPQLSSAPGVCYLRLWSSAEETDEVGMLLESVSACVES